jgi:hypothetical protein
MTAAVPFLAAACGMRLCAITRAANFLMGDAGSIARGIPWNEKTGPKIERKPDF